MLQNARNGLGWRIFPGVGKGETRGSGKGEEERKGEGKGESNREVRVRKG